ncbi:MAG: ATPase, partial [Anaerolineae bacterium]|nr:ATPase [Anaerolineae bacterium]
PLQHWMETGHFEVEGGWGMFAIQSAAEVLEKFISMLSNTLSYVRVGAFAIVHAGLTGAVFVIARLLGEEGSIAYWTTVVLGNLFVIGLDGFIVTIQTMRLHFYEFFSKFFRGGGSPYEPLALATAQEK